jgi:hypothetical protein
MLVEMTRADAYVGASLTIAAALLATVAASAGLYYVRGPLPRLAMFAVLAVAAASWIFQINWFAAVLASAAVPGFAWGLIRAAHFATDCLLVYALASRQGAARGSDESAREASSCPQP